MKGTVVSFMPKSFLISLSCHLPLSWCFTSSALSRVRATLSSFHWQDTTVRSILLRLNWGLTKITIFCPAPPPI